MPHCVTLYGPLSLLHLQSIVRIMMVIDVIAGQMTIFSKLPWISHVQGDKLLAYASTTSYVPLEKRKEQIKIQPVPSMVTRL